MSSLTNADVLRSLSGESLLARGILLVDRVVVHSHSVALGHPVINMDATMVRIDAGALWGMLRHFRYDLFTTVSDPLYVSLINTNYRSGNGDLASILSYMIDFSEYQVFLGLTGPYPTPVFEADYMFEREPVHNWKEEGF